MGNDAPLEVAMFHLCRDLSRWRGIPAGTIAMLGLTVCRLRSVKFRVVLQGGENEAAQRFLRALHI